MLNRIIEEHKPLKKSISLLITLAVLAVPMSAQDIGDKLSAMLSANAKLYLDPLPTVVGIAMNSATFQRARSHKLLGFDATFSLGIVATPADGQTYEFDIPDFDITVPIAGTDYTVTLANGQLYNGSRTAQNIFGEKTETIFAADSNYAYTTIKTQLAAAGVPDNVLLAVEAQLRAAADGIPDLFAPPGLGAGGFPIFVPQLSLGLPMGLEVSFRGGIEQDISNFGSIKYGGIGGKIYLNKFIPTVPLLFPAISIGFYTTNLDIETDEASLSAKNRILNLQVSKSIPFITVFGGVGLENSTLDVAYTFTDPSGLVDPLELSFDLKGDNRLRTTVGARLKFLLLTFHGAWVKNGDYTGLYGGLGLTIR